jgi:hypothetical protein
VKTFKLSNDPRFEEKLIDVVGLYLNPPEQAVVLCMDERRRPGRARPPVRLLVTPPPTRHRVERSYRGQPYRGMVPPMKVDKLSVSFDPDLGDAVRAAARHSGGGVSRWLADAAAAKLRAEALSDFLDAWEAEHGSLTSAELSKAATELALPKPASTEPAA